MFDQQHKFGIYGDLLNRTAVFSAQIATRLKNCFKEHSLNRTIYVADIKHSQNSGNGYYFSGDQHDCFHILISFFCYLPIAHKTKGVLC